ncbi:MAG: lipoyl synthase [Bacteroidetes bacterium GWE2_41_25]|nr:MAG: lipoyl synthase [Bacteroidetes bacterium GWA2_40_15]OFX98039.1 MAG: lipoyl synthase [Bacteroidetes bacterium GWC2_40_22]OFY09787.1 MAG: lipoyl synthase [Bacteroidetes bacterium GWE2_41_25]OFY57767.1 MAG: lipoyl synthase [Bacteroidetes bacterium GWF2_41_9]HBH83733.1 lipoyl synthase [Bacteroidales bacterium]
MSIKTDKTHLPPWMKVPLPHGKNYSLVKNIIDEQKLNTICSSGNCPNKGECWSAGTATFMILGDKCTRNCRFCYVKSMMPDQVDNEEPDRVANAIMILALKHCVITSVARDDLNDQGASVWARTIKTIKKVNPGITIETLIPDFNNNHDLIDLVINEKPEVISHNIETVERISPGIRSLATYEKSLKVLKYISGSGLITKSGFMVGLGESETEVIRTMDDLLMAGVKVLTIGQYLPPSERHTRLVEYVKPEVFEHYKKTGLEKGFRFVESGPLVRSSYHAEKHIHI